MLNAPFLLILFDSVYLIVLATWLGSMLFLTIGVVPVLFRTLDKENAERFARGLFPVYYQFGTICGVIALPALVCRSLSFPELRGLGTGLQSLALIALILLMLYCGQSLTPAINRARDEGEAGKPKFNRLHRRSERLNVLAVLAVAALMVAFAIRPAPKNSGIRDWTPEEKARYDLELVDQIHRPRLKKEQEEKSSKTSPAQPAEPSSSARP